MEAELAAFKATAGPKGPLGPEVAMNDFHSLGKLTDDKRRERIAGPAGAASKGKARAPARDLPELRPRRERTPESLSPVGGGATPDPGRPKK
eukprot:484056-Heterocapsa_arctica.AAC.1